MGIETGLLIGGASLASGLLGANAAKSAASTQVDAANRATDLQKQMYDQTRTDQAPWRDAGVNALTQLTAGTGPGGSMVRPFAMSDFQTDPGYQFRLSEGLKNLNNMAAARGGYLSGNSLKAGQTYAQNTASAEYQNAYQRYQQNQGNIFNRLSTIAGYGPAANAVTGQAGQNYAGNAGNKITGGAAANSAGTVGAANALTGAFGSYLNYNQNQNMMNLLGNRSSYGSPSATTPDYGPM